MIPGSLAVLTPSCAPSGR